MGSTPPDAFVRISDASATLKSKPLNVRQGTYVGIDDCAIPSDHLQLRQISKAIGRHLPAMTQAVSITYQHCYHSCP